MNEKEQKVSETLKKAQNPLKTSEIADISGLNSKDVSKIISKLKREGFVISPKRCYYTSS